MPYLRQPYDVILMDIQMPEVDGIEATHRIRSSDHVNRQPHIVAMTAAVTPEDRTACLAAGMDAYVTKPVNIQQLVDVLRGLSPQPRVLTDGTLESGSGQAKR